MQHFIQAICWASLLMDLSDAWTEDDMRVDHVGADVGNFIFVPSIIGQRFRGTASQAFRPLAQFFQGGSPQQQQLPQQQVAQIQQSQQVQAQPLQPATGIADSVLECIRKPASTCTDDQPAICPMLAGSGGCLRRPGIALKLCQKSCGNCDCSICTDSSLRSKCPRSPNCESANVQSFCPKSCAKCGLGREDLGAVLANLVSNAASAMRNVFSRLTNVFV